MGSEFESLPTVVTSSTLWQRLEVAPGLRTVIYDLREIASQLGAKVAELIPEFTDHSVKHMDALWQIADRIFTPQEVALFSVSEAFVLGSTFYVHDLGMALAATQAGREALERGQSYSANFERLTTLGLDVARAKVIALRIAAREEHAHRAEALVDEKLLGLDRFLLEHTETRERWGAYIGSIAASHHWSLQEVDQKLGIRGRVPDPSGSDIDLGFVACALRLIDYAHINHGRASTLDRLLRSEVPPDSLVHWRAQATVTGPIRENNELVFGSFRGTDDVDGWWTFYEMATGLDREIASVSDYLNSRAISKGRFSLVGVRGVRDPQTFARLVTTAGFEPIDIQFRPDSMDRLVNLLGGPQLYGKDRLAAVRELLQNARDAILLRQFAEKAAGQQPQGGEIRVALALKEEHPALSVQDNGVGMNQRLITNYLLGVAADYWNSPDFYAEHPFAKRAGFRPVGRFGIGFLSVFMLGDTVEVSTRRSGGPPLLLRLNGIGRRGSLVRTTSGPPAGTRVTITLRASELADYEDFDLSILARAPMINMPIVVEQDTDHSRIVPGWWKSRQQDDFLQFIEGVPGAIPGFERDFNPDTIMHGDSRLLSWTGDAPEALSESYRIVAKPELKDVILCSDGFTIQHKSVPGFSGVVDLGSTELNAARSTTLNWDYRQFRSEMLKRLRPEIISALNTLVTEGDIPSRFEFLSAVGRRYGLSTLLDSSLPWMAFVDEIGNTHLMSPAQLGSELEKFDYIVLVAGAAGPWAANVLAKTVFPGLPARIPVLPVALTTHAQAGSYTDSDEVIWGELTSHFGVPDRRTPFVFNTLQNAALLSATLRLVAQRWGVEEAVLHGAQWGRVKRTLCGWLKRP